MQVLTDLQNRGVKDIFIACVDGLKGFPETIETVYPGALCTWCGPRWGASAELARGDEPLQYIVAGRMPSWEKV